MPQFRLNPLLYTILADSHLRVQARQLETRNPLSILNGRLYPTIREYLFARTVYVPCIRPQGTSLITWVWWS